MKSRKSIWLTAGGILAAIVAMAFLWPAIGLGIAVSISEKPPEILTDFSWPDQIQSEKFSSRFPAGSSESELLAWLSQEGFEIDTQAQIARRSYSGVPCKYDYEITWTANGRILSDSAVAKVVGYGCL